MLYRAEALTLGCIAALVATIAALYLTGSTEVAWSGFAMKSTLAMTLALFGCWLRIRGWLGMTSVTFVAFGLYAIHSNLLAIVNYLLFPLQRPLIDDALLRFDAWLGYDWARAVAWLAQWPEVSGWLAWLYLTSIPQLVLLIVLLGVLRRPLQLHCMIVTGIVAATATIAFWSFWPSFGPSAHVALDPDLADRAGLVVRPEYGAYLIKLGAEGLARLETHLILGTVAFPSFHTVMLLMVVVYTRGTPVFWPAVLLNLPMIPAILVHGGHHLADILGGAVVFALAAALSRRVLAADLYQPAHGASGGLRAMLGAGLPAGLSARIRTGSSAVATTENPSLHRS